ncbi:MAG: polysaccharide deacetylase family sporulation protein PdaB [Thermoanaerobacterales bacterium]|nr:polysaccharide deacetylase family sporulation protein PdaB [Bacillota bacterium]MDI6907527.1 polysaccharide deacetylase family sporulation protein PdaB [Thermoanaerobacterales bacterium]
MRLYYVNLNRLKRNCLWGALFLLLGLLFTLVILQQPATTVTTSHSRIVYKVRTQEKVAALTFDISWGDKTVGPVLDTLKKENVKCTFFLSGPWAVKHPDIPKRIAADGHEIASHGYRHENYSQMSDKTIAEEIGKTHEILKDLTGQSPKLIRTPNGDWNERVLDAIAGTGYTAVQWSVDSLDWKRTGAEAMRERILRLIHPGAVILMHASDSAEHTPEALPMVIKGLKEKGYKLVTVSELLKYGRGVAE